MERRIGVVNKFTTGWVTYVRRAACKSALVELDEWLRRKFRCVGLEYCKGAKPIAGGLVKNNIPEWRAGLLALAAQG